ncbi:MAG: septal ring lytic transglycosylase RlpA family protein [Emcibacter sp.]|nr:septal ring lytic transglycosylase RlpA family protein [Emcibacter sp.]
MIFLRRAVIIIFCLSVAGCGATKGTYEASVPNPVHKVGNPYKIAGKTYHPAIDPHYDRVGLASWYGSQFHGRKTANGDVFNMNDLTAAHTTLPMPSHVRVTNVENGRWLILMVNDRGPFVGDRIIDVSRRAAQLLGFEKKGVTKVRVQAVTGPRGELPKQIIARETTPKPRVITAPVVQVAQNEAMTTETKAKRIYIQIGAYADQKNAKKVVNAVHHISDTKMEEVDINGQNLYRVRVGPQPTVELAEIILGRILSLGHNTARIIMDY